MLQPAGNLRFAAEAKFVFSMQPAAVANALKRHRTAQFGVVGDVDFAAVRQVAGALTPSPGGLGPLTHLILLRHTLIGPT